MDLPTSLAETTKGLAKEYIKGVVETIRTGMGGRASDAVNLSPDEELIAWMKPTASPEKIAQMIAEGADDDTIFQTARKYRYALGKAAGQGNPKRETEYHERMAAKAQAYLAGLQHQPAMGEGAEMANVPTRGRFDKGKNKGRLWEVYADPASKTGYTRKNWDPYDTSNDGKPTEYFEDFNYAAAEVDAENAASSAAAKAAKDAQRAAESADDDRRWASFWQGVQQANERTYQEGVRQFDEELGLSRDELGLKRDELGLKRDELGLQERLGSRELDIRELDTRSRLQLGLRELELREREGGASDMRARERNVLDYLGAIGKLRLPYPELQALTQRAVAGIVPGAAAPGAVAPGAPAGAGGAGVAGALTPDQWAALAQGVARDWEQRQIGQGSALAA